MFLKTVMERNQPLVRLGIEWQQNGVILPDTYLLDYDTILENARSIKQAGDANGVQNFFMLKQIGRNPLIARALTDMGYVGAVCVDFREALTMVENQIPLGNVGHLVQIPRAALKKILRAKPVIVTVYTLEKAREISAVCTELGLHQKLMLRVLGEGDMLYSGQYGGFELQELDSAVRAIEAMPNVEVGGVCSFPCFLYDEAAQDILPMPNLRTVQTAAEMLRARGYRDLMLNTPSATCTHSIPMIAAAGVSILITAFWNDAVSFMSTKWDSIVIFVVAVWLLKKKNWNPILVMVLSGFAKLAVQGVLALVGIV